MTNAQRYQYAQEVWTAFKDKSAGSPRMTLGLMTPAEWSVVATWMDRDIPLRVVLRAFKDTKGKDARTLLYFAGPVEQAYRHWIEATQ